MEWMPRITRAQSMDILSSQSNLAGYKSVVEAAAAYGRAFPMMMTAAGTVSPAKVFVMGVGVAGLQAIATAKRLGAQVSATDVALGDEGADPVARRQADLRRECRGDRRRGCWRLRVRNVCGISESAGGAGVGPHRQAGYRHHDRADPRKARAAADQRRADRHDACRAASSSTWRRKPAAMSKGRWRRSRVEKHGVTIIGASNLARSLAADASALFARNLYNFLSAFWDKEQAGQCSR